MSTPCRGQTRRPGTARLELVIRTKLPPERFAASVRAAVRAIDPSLALSKLLSSMLYGVTATDAVTLGGTVMLLLALAGVAGYLPARRAARVDPITVLRV